MAILEHTGELVVLRCWCGVQHAVPQSLRDVQLRQHNDGRKNVQGIYCPLGHQHVPTGTTKCDELAHNLANEAARLAREVSRHDQTKAELRETENRRRAEKGAKTRLKNRVAAGVCPCCNRTFQNLARHIKGQHPDFTTTPSEPEA